VLSKYIVRGMMAQERGRVINICSIVASTGFNALSVYAATERPSSASPSRSHAKSGASA